MSFLLGVDWVYRRTFSGTVLVLLWALLGSCEGHNWANAGGKNII
jgi:hypothetical protein